MEGGVHDDAVQPSVAGRFWQAHGDVFVPQPAQQPPQRLVLLGRGVEARRVAEARERGSERSRLQRRRRRRQSLGELDLHSGVHLELRRGGGGRPSSAEGRSRASHGLTD